MPRLAVLASGGGSNFEALARAVEPTDHECVLLVCDRAEAGAFGRAARLGVPARLVRYDLRPRREAEAEIVTLLDEFGADLVALAGFLRILSPGFVRLRAGRILNVHPSLLPDYPGLDALRRAWDAREEVYGATVHLVDEGLDSGPVLRRASLRRLPGESFAELEARIHALEHTIYREAVLSMLDGLSRGGGVGS
ncbi:MAG TPA: phosphoribosylglycinamide formyltransferase [Magnetospirillaceae bacterium]|nr:phosphoribosylglycinamide formyltransferase [Magnetospirillaceae bacterium]